MCGRPSVPFIHAAPAPASQVRIAEEKLAMVRWAGACHTDSVPHVFVCFGRDGSPVDFNTVRTVWSGKP